MKIENNPVTITSVSAYMSCCALPLPCVFPLH
jgi:hypothetical protein